MVEKRNTAAFRKINLNAPEPSPEDVDEIHLTGRAEEETKGVSSSSEEETKGEEKEEVSKFPIKRPLNREGVQAYSRWLHRNCPPNYYFRVKIPYKTILIAIVFLIVGFVLLYMGITEMMARGDTEAIEKLVLGCILFIPGSFHTFIAF